MNHRRLNTGRMERNGIAFGEGLFISSPPSRSRIGGRAHRACRSESGFGGWVDEKIQTAREAVPYHCQTIPQSTEPKKSHPQHLTIALTQVRRFVRHRGPPTCYPVIFHPDVSQNRQECKNLLCTTRCILDFQVASQSELEAVVCHILCTTLRYHLLDGFQYDSPYLASMVLRVGMPFAF